MESTLPQELENQDLLDSFNTVVGHLGIIEKIFVVLGLLIGTIAFFQLFPEITFELQFIAGLMLVFAMSEFIVLSIKGISLRLGLDKYLIAVITGACALFPELIVVIFLILAGGASAQFAVTLILTTVLLNMLMFGVAVMYITRKAPHKPSPAISNLESENLLGMIIFGFLLATYSLVVGQGAVVEVVAIEWIGGIILVLLYAAFIVNLALLLKKLRQDAPPQSSNKSSQASSHDDSFYFKVRFPVFVVLFILGIIGSTIGGDLLSAAIEHSLEQYEDLPLLLLTVVVGTFTTLPEILITSRALLDPSTEELGLNNQLAAITQTFYILFGFCFLVAALVGVKLALTSEFALLFGSIAVISLGMKLSIIDDHKMTRMEGILLFAATLAGISFLLFVL